MSPVLSPELSLEPEISRGFDRRQFLKMVGGGIAILVTVGPAELFAQ